MSWIWNNILLNPIFNLLAFLYQNSGSLGISIIIFTIIAKFILIPVTIPSLKMSKKQTEIQPELEKIKNKFKYDKKKQAELQMEVMKKHGINPGAGCITTIITFILMIAVYRAVSAFTFGNDLPAINQKIYFDSLKFSDGEIINTNFLYLNLTKPDPYLVLTILTVLTQFLATKMIMPYSKISQKIAKKTPEQSDDLVASMQKQNMYLMPLMFFIFGLTLPSGVMLYIFISTIFQIVQTYFFSGWGGLKPWISNLKFVKKKVA